MATANIIQLVIALFTAFAAAMALLNVLIMRRAHDDEVRPVVEVFVEVDGRDLVIVIENFGTHPASNVKVQFAVGVPVSTSQFRQIATDPIFRMPIPVLPPGTPMRNRLDDRFDFFRAKSICRWQYEISYDDLVSHKHYDVEQRQLSACHLEPNLDELVAASREEKVTEP